MSELQRNLLTLAAPKELPTRCKTDKRTTQTQNMKRTPSKPVEFSCFAPDAQAVFVAGSFNDWSTDAVPLQRQADGHWRVVVPLPSGRYEVKFVVDGKWCCDPGCEHERQGCPKCVRNEFGTMNRVLEVT